MYGIKDSIPVCVVSCGVSGVIQILSYHASALFLSQTVLTFPISQVLEVRLAPARAPPQLNKTSWSNLVAFATVGKGSDGAFQIPI